MNSMAKLEENPALPPNARTDSFTEGELRLFENVREKLLELQLIPCTGLQLLHALPRMWVDIPT
jgi:predicted aldo/keto reductase-like oxidoreductase